MAVSAAEPESQAAPDWKVPARGVYASFTIALRRLLWSKFMLANALLSGIPLGLAAIVTLALVYSGETKTVAEIHDILQGFLRILYLHFIVFFLANVFGFAVVRQEIEGQTLHYLLLQPVQRWALFLGRFFAYLAIVSATCIGSLWIGYLIFMIPLCGLGETAKDLAVAGHAWALVKESGVLALGLAAYGAIAMLAGSFFKTAMYAILLLVWEWVLPYVPQALKEWTVLYYLQSLLPEKAQDTGKLFELLGDLAGTGRSLLVLSLVVAIALGGAMAMFQRKECMYSDT
jgi:ABC-type transport system involved in multi-copper enzyme maturation permease subunit